jgi:hypothetical protein
MGSTPGKIATRRAREFDAALELRDYDAAALSATTSGTGKEFNVRTLMGFKAVIDNAAIGGTVDGSNYWTITIEVSDVIGGTYTAIGSIRLPATAGSYDIPLSGEWAEQLDSDCKFIRVTATETGTTAGNLTYGAYLSPIC